MNTIHIDNICITLPLGVMLLVLQEVSVGIQYSVTASVTPHPHPSQLSKSQVTPK